MTRNTGRYGNYYWCVKSALSENGDIYIMADRVQVLPDGTLVFEQLATHDTKRDTPPKPLDAPLITIAFAPGQWKAFFAASLFDGAAVAVEHWKGEIVEG